ncbi:unnamed protein product, partial [Polarella glacialis]
AFWDESASWAASVSSQAASISMNAAKAVQKELILTFEDYACHVHPVRKNLFAMEFPSRSRQHWQGARLNRDHPGGYMVVNLSGCTYETVELQGPVMDVIMSGSVPPLEVLLRLCVSAHRWLGRSSNNVIVAHGLDDRGGAAVGPGIGPVVLLFACYLSWAGLADHPKEAMLEVCNTLGIKEEVSPSQARYLSYFELLQRGRLDLATQATMRLARLVLMELGAGDYFRAVEAWQQDKLLFRADVDDDSMSHAFAFRVDVLCRGDLSIRVLRRQRPDEGQSGAVGQWELEIQVCFHTALVALARGFARFTARELDVSGGGPLEDGCAIDVFLEQAGDEDQEDAEAATAIATAAAVEGPKQAEEGIQFFDLSADDEGDPPEESPEPFFPTQLVDGGHFNRVSVFAPDDIDAFFDEL